MRTIPKHVLATDKEIEELLEQYKVTKSQLPRLPPTDPVAKYYGFKNTSACFDHSYCLAWRSINLLY